MTQTTDHIKSKTRVADHGEVFTPSWLVEIIVRKRIPSHAILLAMPLKIAGSVKVESFEDSSK